MERGVASGLAVIAQEVKAQIDKEIRERFAKIAGEARLKIRKIEIQAGIEKNGKKAIYDPLMHTKMPGLLGNEMHQV